MKKEDSIQEAKTRRFLMILPVLVMPFLFLLCWGIGIKFKGDNEQVIAGSKVNMQLPDANFTNQSPKDKMSFYTQAKNDSIKRGEQLKLDSYNTSSNPLVSSPQYNPFGQQTSLASNQMTGIRVDPNEARIYKKLGDLNTALNQPLPVPVPNSSYQPLGASSGMRNEDLDRLEKMMTMMQNTDNNKGDPEMQQINSVLERIVDIQHPERVQNKIKAIKDNRQVYQVTSDQEDNPVTIMVTPPKLSKGNNVGFYGIDQQVSAEQENTISVIVHDNQTVVSGSIVKLRLLNDIMIHGERIPKDNFVFGQAQINGERLVIEINSIRFNNSIYPVNLSVYDLDGMDGIHIPGAISRDLLKDQGTDVMQNIGLTNYDQSIGMQAASAGVELSKSFIRKKVKQVKVTLKAGYKLLLKDNRQN